ncbi:MAG: pitrilysin family protein [Vampirovibrionales bacterium]|nr:pitrilysin family protein [Vampirovibrionales bacterium]
MTTLTETTTPTVTREEAFDVPFLPEKGRLVEFENGHQLVYVPKRGEVFNISTWVTTGSIHEDDVNNGVSHFLEHLMFKGTEKAKPGEFDKAMESMGAIINAATWKDFTFYYITGPNMNNGGNFLKALEMHADMLLNSTLPEAEIGPQYDPDDASYKGEKRERSVVIEEIAMREDQPWTKVFNGMNHAMYANQHPYQRDVIGTRQIIGNIPRETIEHYYKSWYAPGSMMTIVVGDFEWETLQSNVAQAFKFGTEHLKHPGKQLWQLGQLNPDVAVAPKPGAPIVQEGDVQTGFAMLGFHGPAPTDLKASIALDCISYCLGESRSSRLHQKLVEQAEPRLFNSIGSGQSAQRLGNVFHISGNFAGKNYLAALGQVNSELTRLLEAEPIAELELQRAKQNLKAGFAETAETASGIAETIGESYTILNNLDGYIKYLSVLEQVTLDEVNAAARQYLNPELAYTAVLLPKG